MRRRTVYIVVGVALIAGVVVVGTAIRSRGKVAWAGPEDPSVVVTERFGKHTENGEAFDRADVDLGGRTVLAVPDSAIVRVGGAGPAARVFLRKRLAYHGHPPEPMSVREVRREMGCAVRDDGPALVLATFGEWDTREGGADVRLVVEVPFGVRVERRAGLSGAKSAARPTGSSGGVAGTGWRAVPDQADRDRVASH